MSLHRFKPSASLHNSGSRKSINTFTPESTAYDRIFSSKHITTQLLPSFLSQPKPKPGLSKLDILRVNLSVNTKVALIVDLSNSPVKLKSDLSDSRLRISSEKILEAKEICSVVNSIFNPTLSAAETVLRLGKRKLSRGELLCFGDGSELTEAVVDAYLSTLRVARGGDQRAEGVLIVNSSYGKALFQAKSVMPTPKVPAFEWKLLVFPVFDGYWAMFTVDLAMGVVRYYDAVVPGRDVGGALVVMKRFLDQTGLGKSLTAGLRMEPANSMPESVNLKESGVYICKLAERMLLGREMGTIDLKVTRRDILNSLIRTSLKLCL